MSSTRRAFVIVPFGKNTIVQANALSHEARRLVE
jgi:hypothetical protein